MKNAKNLLRSIALLASLSLAVCAAAQTTTLAEYTFATGTSPTAATPGLASSAVAFGAAFPSSMGRSGAGNLFFAGGSGSQTDANNGYTTWATSQSDAHSKNYYATFNLTPQAGRILAISNLSLKFGGSDNAGVGAFTANVEVRSSLDNYQTALRTQAYNVTAGANTSNTPAAFSLNLAADPLFQSITSASGVTFRVYVWADNYTGDTAGSAFANSIRLDDFKVTGNLAAIPEPAGAMLMLGGLGLALSLASRLRPVRSR